MKKICALLSFLLCLSFLLFCQQEEDITVYLEEDNGEKAPVTTEEKAEEWYPYDLSDYISLPDPIGIQAKYDEVGICTEEEVEKAIFLIRLGTASFQPKEGEAQLYDRVKVDYELIRGGQTVEEESLSLVLGTETDSGAHNALSQELLGAKIGEMRWADYTYPESVLHGELSGQTVVAKGTVTAIESPVLPDFNEEFVHSISGYEDYSVKEFSAAVKKDILAEKETAKVNAVWSAFCERVEVLNYPEAELEAYCQDYIRYYSDFAKAMEMDLETFLFQYMETDLATFQQDAQEYAKEMVKNDMIFVGLSRYLGISLSQEEFQEGAVEYYNAEKDRFDTLKDFIDHYSEESIRQNLIRDKALMIVVENAIRIQ